MAETIEGYLAELRSALSSADPALAQDALYDAEEYLRSAAAEGGGTPASVAAAIDAYGTPQEVAAAYRETERTVTAALRRPAPPAARSPWGRFFGVAIDPSAYAALFYMLLSLATGIAYFTVVVTGLSMTFGLIVLVIGIPFALLVLAIVRAISLAEGRIVEGLLGVRMPRRPRTVGRQGDWLTRIKSWLTDYRTWTTMLYMLLQLPLGIVYFTAVVTALTTSVAVFAAPIAQVVLDTPVAQWGGYAYYIEYWAMPLFFAGGLLGFVLTLWLAKGIGYAHGAYAKAMLVGRLEAVAPAAGPAPPVPPVSASSGDNFVSPPDY